MNQEQNHSRSEDVDLAELAQQKIEAAFSEVSNPNQTAELARLQQSAQPSPESPSLQSAPEAVRVKQVQPIRSFHNARDPQYTLFREKPEHRVVCYLKAQGLNHKEIAERTGYTTVAIAYICAQKWAQELIAEELTQAGRSRVEYILSEQAVPSLEKLITLRDDPEVNKEVQRKAANDLLDRIFGKPNQPITHKTIDPNELSNEELARIARGSPTN